MNRTVLSKGYGFHYLLNLNLLHRSEPSLSLSFDKKTLVYLAGVSVLNIGFLWYALRMMRSKDVLLPMHTFAFSITYLMVLFIFLLADHYVINHLLR